MNKKIKSIFRFTYLGTAPFIIKFLSELLQTTYLLGVGGILITVYLLIKLFKKKLSFNANQIKAWILRILIWLISIIWTPLIGFSLLGVCLFILSFIFIIVSLMEDYDFIEMVETFFIELITDKRFIGIVGIFILFIIGLSIYVLITQGWREYISMLQYQN